MGIEISGWSTDKMSENETPAVAYAQVVTHLQHQQAAIQGVEDSLKDMGDKIFTGLRDLRDELKREAEENNKQLSSKIDGINAKISAHDKDITAGYALVKASKFWIALLLALLGAGQAVMIVYLNHSVEQGAADHDRLTTQQQQITTLTESVTKSNQQLEGIIAGSNIAPSVQQSSGNYRQYPRR